jgi:DNA-binding transcriptional LysR family regulator
VLSSFLAQSDVTSGRLVRVLPRFSHTTTTLLLAYPKTAHVPRKVSAFRDFLLEFLAVRPLALGQG